MISFEISEIFQSNFLRILPGDCLYSFIDFDFFVPDVDIVNKNINGKDCVTYGNPPTMDGMQLYNAIIVIEDWKVKCVCKPAQELFEMANSYYCIGMISKLM